MLKEGLKVKRYLGLKFGYGENIPDGVYAIPTTTSKGNAFMRMEIKNNAPAGKDNFLLFWDEELTLNWDTLPNPFLEDSDFVEAYRKILKLMRS